MRYNLDFAVKLAKKFIKDKEVDPRKYARIRSCLCDWLKSQSRISKYVCCDKERKANYSLLSTTLNRLDEYYNDRVGYLYWTTKATIIGDMNK